jgi:hypothetical protein
VNVHQNSSRSLARTQWSFDWTPLEIEEVGIFVREFC